MKTTHRCPKCDHDRIVVDGVNVHELAAAPR
jgi:hypothetical protein